MARVSVSADWVSSPLKDGSRASGSADSPLCAKNLSSVLGAECSPGTDLERERLKKGWPAIGSGAHLEPSTQGVMGDVTRAG
jgi:hypothetical protein